MSTSTHLPAGPVPLLAADTVRTRPAPWGPVVWGLCLTAATVAALSLASISQGLAAPGEQPARWAAVRPGPAGSGDTSVPDAASALRLAPDAPTEAAPTF